MKLVVIFSLYHFVIFNNALDSDNRLSLEGKLAQGYKTFKPFKYVAGLYETNVLFCSGVLISQKHVLTVAVCLKNFVYDLDIEFSHYHAILGSDSLRASRLDYVFQEVLVPKQYDYVKEDLPYNIGIVALKIPHDETPFKTWFYWSRPKIMIQDTLFLLGWKGKEYSEENAMSSLSFAEVTLMSMEEECVQIPHPKNVTKDMLCTHLNRKRKFSEEAYEMQNHDLGAPLVDIDGELVGLLCFIEPTKRKNSIGIYTNIFKQNQWIFEALCQTDYRPNNPKQYISVTSKGIFHSDVNSSVKTLQKRQQFVNGGSVKEEPLEEKPLKEDLLHHESQKRICLRENVVQQESVNKNLEYEIRLKQILERQKALEQELRDLEAQKLEYVDEKPSKDQLVPYKPTKE